MAAQDGGSGGMGRQALLAAAAVAVLAGAAYVAHQAIFTESGAPSALTVPTSALLAPTSASAPASAVRPGRERAVIRTLTGQAERQMPDGSWRSLRVDDVVGEEDTIRTAEGGQVGIDLGPNVSVQVSEGTEVRIVELTRALALVRLSDGRILSVARGRKGSAFRVETLGSDAVAEAEDAEFAVMTRKRGHLAVATTKGQVKLSAKGEAVAVRAGQQSLVTPGAPPSQPLDIPPELFLELGPPPPRRTAADSITVSGRTSPGAILNIRGKRHVVTDDNGEFSEVVALQEGDNNIVVSVHDVMGRGKSEQLPVVTVDVRVRAAPTTEVAW